MTGADTLLFLVALGWLFVGLAAANRFPALSWALLAWAVISASFTGYLIGHDKGDRDATQRLERDEREREEARERFAREQAAQVQHSRRN